ncbi:MAG: shikimate kinase, partial [Nitrospinaceae bacterium]|nr:shikimate kinase [Nitrospinaceae bacterium]
MNIVLIGYRGTGKSVLSRLLAKQLECERYGLDEWIVQEAGKPVPEIVKLWGWGRFREIERRVVEKVSARARD